MSGPTGHKINLICIFGLMLLLLAGCSFPDVKPDVASKGAHFYAYNGYAFTQFNITENDDGSYTITVTAEKGGAK